MGGISFGVVPRPVFLVFQLRQKRPVSVRQNRTDARTRFNAALANKLTAWKPTSVLNERIYLIRQSKLVLGATCQYFPNRVCYISKFTMETTTCPNLKPHRKLALGLPRQPLSEFRRWRFSSPWGRSPLFNQ